MDLLIKNIKSLVQVEDIPQKLVAGKRMSEISTISDAWLLLSGGLIKDFGKMSSCPLSTDDVIDAAGKMVFPSFCDSHTHLVYSGSREIEYGDKIRGLSYEEIAKRGGGILNSAKLLHDTSEDSLYEQSMKRINEIIKLGTGAVEIKSGYGLNADDELKMLRVIKRIKETSPITVKSTFLGAHSIPAEFKNNQGDYVDVVINEMIPLVAAENLADYIDVFCDKGFFTVEETDRILLAGMKYGMKPKIHANELDYSGGIQVGVKYAALSVDHLEFTGEEEIKCLLDSETMPTLLPGAISGDQAICLTDDPVVFTSDAVASGGNPPLSYQWYHKLDAAAWAALPGETNDDYDDCSMFLRKLCAFGGGWYTHSNYSRQLVGWRKLGWRSYSGCG